ncbi:MAG: hypothetical protein B6I31_00235 [Desulfobacteraceae bacterium 4572_19]|nr:MAG: hypothetical protein B6I31_00235 [Desulfobacteraceae bacterium 4572_19]
MVRDRTNKNWELLSFSTNGQINSILKSQTGSALIFVLWILVTVLFLSGEYLAHNREKAGIATNAMDSLKRRQAVESILHLFATDKWPLPTDMGFAEDEPLDDKNKLDTGDGKNEDKGIVLPSNSNNGVWVDLAPGGIELSVKVEEESKKVNINSAPDSKIREVIRKIVGADEEIGEESETVGNTGQDKKTKDEETSEEQADQITDAILDWKDPDTLVRLEGAEALYYKDNNLPYEPSNGKFNTLTELLLVKDVSPELFWGEANSDDYSSEFDYKEEEEIENDSLSSLLDAFTIYPKGTKRIIVKVPGKGSGYYIEVVFIKKEKNRWVVLDRYSTMR